MPTFFKIILFLLFHQGIDMVREGGFGDCSVTRNSCAGLFQSNVLLVIEAAPFFAERALDICMRERPDCEIKMEDRIDINEKGLLKRIIYFPVIREIERDEIMRKLEPVSSHLLLQWGRQLPVN